MNAGRSVTAKVLTEYYGGDAVDVYSAGSEPGDEIHPEVARVLTGLGLDVTREVPKKFDPDGRYDVVTTMNCGEQCPYYSGARYQDWEVDDPKGQDEATVRRIVSDLDGRVRALLTELVPDHKLPPSVFEQPAGDARP
jgi:arsenate reductase (thioredoxin)